MDVTLSIAFRDAVKAKFAGFDAIAARIAATQGITVPVLAQVYGEKPANAEFPCARVPLPTGRVTEITGESITSEVETWALVGVSCADPTERDALIEVYQAALLSLFSEADSDITLMPSDWDASPPGVEDNEQVQYAGVHVSATLTER